MHPDLISYVHRRTPAGQLSVIEHLSAPLIPAWARIFDLIGARLDRTSVNLPAGSSSNWPTCPTQPCARP